MIRYDAVARDLPHVLIRVSSDGRRARPAAYLSHFLEAIWGKGGYMRAASALFTAHRDYYVVSRRTVA
jgi:hypothetical protein